MPDLSSLYMLQDAILGYAVPLRVGRLVRQTGHTLATLVLLQSGELRPPWGPHLLLHAAEIILM